MIGNILVSVSLAVVTIALLDLFLSESQKQSIEESLIHVWNRLDELKHANFYSLLAKRKNREIFVGIAVVLSLLIAQGVAPILFLTPVGILLTAAAIFAIYEKIANYIFSASTLVQAIGRTSIVLACSVSFNILQFFGIGSQVIIRSLNDVQIIVLILRVLTGSALITWIVLIIPLTVLPVVRGALYASELIIRRVAEYPKGPLIAVGILFSAIAGIINALR